MPTKKKIKVTFFLLTIFIGLSGKYLVLIFLLIVSHVSNIFGAFL